jgi:3-methyladenine DNA glycosylase AlkD
LGALRRSLVETSGARQDCGVEYAISLRKGDVDRTREVCRLLVGDHDDLVVKAMSGALRELVVHDAGAVRSFLREGEEVLGARVYGEVRNKLTTCLKNPRIKKD